MPRLKKKDYENLSSENVAKVVSLMNPETGKPITKKEACQILNIAYNTTRLAKILQDHEENVAYVQLRKSQNKGKAATAAEKAEAIRYYLQGDSISSIAKSLYRSPGFIKNIIEQVGVPSKPTTKEEKKKVDYLPDECAAEDFKVGEIVWSARHHAPAEIREELSIDHQAEKAGFSDVNYEKKYSSKCYAIWVMENIDQDKEMWISGVETGGYNAYALAYDLGKLSHLEDYGVDLRKI